MPNVNRMFQRAFTLIEVNLAIFIMAGGVLAMISLYSLGFRESSQSREDLAAAAFADTVLNPLVVALSSTNITWSQWRSIPLKKASDGVKSGEGDGEVYVLPNKGSQKEGWYAYFETRGAGRTKAYYVSSDPRGLANDVYKDLLSRADASLLPSAVHTAPPVPDGMTYALVASREGQFSPIITLAVRCVREKQRNSLMSQPVFATEVHFQGDPNR